MSRTPMHKKGVGLRAAAHSVVCLEGPLNGTHPKNRDPYPETGSGTFRNPERDDKVDSGGNRGYLRGVIHFSCSSKPPPPTLREGPNPLHQPKIHTHLYVWPRPDK